MKYIFFVLNVVTVLAGHYLLFLIWRYFFGLSGFYSQLIVIFLLFVSVFLTVVAPLLVYWRDNIFSRSLYLAVALWMGMMLNIGLVAALFFLLGAVGFYQTEACPLALKACLISLVPALMLLPEAWLAQTSQIKRFEVKIKDLPAAWVGREIVHISDIHLGPIWRQRFFDYAVNRVNAIGAAAIFITGDVFDGMDGDFSWFCQRQFSAPLGVFYAFGNHDLKLGADKVRSLLSDSNIQILDNEMREVEGLQILGLTCYYQGRLDVKGKILAQVGYEPKKPSLLMYHEPQDIKAARAAGIDLQLSGHTHAGQMFPFDILANLLYGGFGHGLHRRRNFTISITAGVGTWGPPLRLGSRSEIVVLKLLKA